MRLIDADALKIELALLHGADYKTIHHLNHAPTVDAVPVVRCKDCKHRPTLTDRECDAGFQYEFPDERCPCQCDDSWYNWRPDDDWYCANGERREHD